MLANGTILVIGGETGSNASPQPNLEILPKPEGGDTVVELEWLKRTDPNNLYPFIFILPTERVFVGQSKFYISCYLLITIISLLERGTYSRPCDIRHGTRTTKHPWRRGQL